MKSYRNLPELEDFRPYAPSAQALARASARDYEPAETLTKGHSGFLGDVVRTMPNGDPGFR